MPSSPRGFAGFVLIASASVLGTALLAQFWGGLAPCELCLMQRWPWDAAVVIAIIVLLVGNRAQLSWVALVFAIVFVVSIAFAFYHVGVEQHWFAGPTACTAGGSAPKTVEELKRQILGQQPVLCDQIQWSLFGISLAGWNLLASLAMAAICLAAFLRARGALPRRGLRRA
jgi:disulfide bond formation protein DsbB